MRPKQIMHACFYHEFVTFRDYWRHVLGYVIQSTDPNATRNGDIKQKYAIQGGNKDDIYQFILWICLFWHVIHASMLYKYVVLSNNKWIQRICKIEYIYCIIRSTIALNPKLIIVSQLDITKILWEWGLTMEYIWETRVLYCLNHLYDCHGYVQQKCRGHKQLCWKGRGVWAVRMEQ